MSYKEPITKVDASLDNEAASTTSATSLEEFLKLELADREGARIQYRTCSWEKTAALLFSEYVCLAVMSFPWSFSVLGVVPGILCTVFVSLCVLYTSLTLWRFCLKHPQVQDICDIGQHLLWGQRWAWWFTAVCFILNNTFIQGLHVLTGAKYLNTITNHAVCTVDFCVVAAVICFVFSLPRTFSGLSFMGWFSAATMFVAIVLSMVFAGVQDHPGGWDGTTGVTWRLWPAKGTTYVQGMNAVLNIVYTFVGQITYPSFIAEMKNPRDFNKAVYAVTIAEIVLYVLTGTIVYVYVGDAYITAPAFGSLAPVYKKIAFSFAVPTLIFLGLLYASVSARFVFFRIYDKHSQHRRDHTVVGWAVWAGLLAATWVVAFVIAEVIPFFSDLLSLMSSLFDCWFGFVYWGLAYFHVRDVRGGLWDKVQVVLNVGLIVLGFYILGPGVYAVVQSIINSYRAGEVGGVFGCADNGL
ncbi:hypothetical protein KL907_003903 [Ogataea polymorpha]|nr:hypothetical protein KL907_003903 [Ogataea polymorpha]